MAVHAWDHASTPRYMDLVDRRFRLGESERAILARQGFVVASRLSYPTYAWALHDIYQSQLPMFVSTDSILHAVFAANDRLIGAVEEQRLLPLTDQVLHAVHCALGNAYKSYPVEVAHDVDLYLTVARSLLAGAPVRSALGTDDEARALINLATDAKGLQEVVLFGRARMVDFSQFTARGHYTKEELRPYFRASMWLSRLEFNLVSRSCRSSQPGLTPNPRETPREAVDALALADLAERAQAMDGVATLDRAWSVLAGKREDVGLGELARLRKKANIGALSIPASADALRAAIGDDFQRTARLHYMPERSPVLPAITTLLGPRVVADTAALRPLVHDEVPKRYAVHAADIAYALGLDRGKSYLEDDLTTFPSLAKQLDAARAIMQAPAGTEDLYSAWLGAILGLAKRPEGVVPSFMATSAFSDFRLNSAVTAYGQLRHNNVLFAGQGYDAAGCDIPDAYVEPASETYAAIREYADRGARALAELDPHDTTRAASYFARLGKIANVFEIIATDELAGRALSGEEKRFLSLVVEVTPPSTGRGPMYTGWYFDLFRDRIDEGLTNADFVADYFTSSHEGRAYYVGATEPRLGFFVIDTGGEPRVMVGPVARGYEIDDPIEHGRLTDETARVAQGKRDPWAKSYTSASPAEPPLAVTQGSMSDDPSTGRKETHFHLSVKSTKDLGPVTIELLNHHRVPVARITRRVGNAPVDFSLPLLGRAPDDIEAVRVTVGAFDYVFTRRVSVMELGPASFLLGGMTSTDGSP